MNDIRKFYNEEIEASVKRALTQLQERQENFIRKAFLFLGIFMGLSFIAIYFFLKSKGVETPGKLIWIYMITNAIFFVGAFTKVKAKEIFLCILMSILTMAFVIFNP